MESMDSKSIEIVCKMEKYISTGMMKPEAFPKDDVLNLVMQQYSCWMTERVRLLQEYFSLCDVFMCRAVKNDDQAGLVEILEEIIQNMQDMPIEVLDEKVDKLRKRFVEIYKRYAKSVYDNYQYQSMLGRRAFRGKGCVYTVITGRYDELREPLYINPAFDYICFTNDSSVKSDVWDVRYIDNGAQDLDNVRLARKYKILCHKFLEEYDYSVYVDGKIHIIGDLNKYIDEYSMGSSMLCFPHFVRDCVYEEAKSCISYSKDKVEIIEEQMDGYKREGYPFKNGLIDSACLVRQHSDNALQQVMECWWEEIERKSRRDQLSIGYACWKKNFHYDLCQLFIYDNQFISKRRDGELSF